MNVLRCTKQPVRRLPRPSAVMRRRGLNSYPPPQYPLPPVEEASTSEAPASWFDNYPDKPYFERTKDDPDRKILRRDLDLSALARFPSLLHPNPYLDNSLTYDEPANWANPFPLKTTIHGATRQFWPIDQKTGRFMSARETAEFHRKMTMAESQDDEEGIDARLASLPRSVPGKKELMRMHQYRVWSRRAVQQTGKGKMSSSAVLMIVGNGDGLVGWGDGKHVEGRAATAGAIRDGLISMDRVERFEGRTIFHEARMKFGATQVVLRPRPLGFGLRAGHIMHQVCKAAGIKDISGEIYGSKNPQNVIKATCLALWSGGARPGMGDGVGGGGRRTEKGQGARSREEIERMRGRNLFIL